MTTMRNLLNILNEETLTEDYDQRVEQTVSDMITAQNSWPRENLESAIEKFALDKNIVDIKTSYKKDFVKDIIKGLRSQQAIKHTRKAKDPNAIYAMDLRGKKHELSEKQIAQIWHAIEMAVGATGFGMDGDPYDRVSDWFRKKGIDSEWMFNNDLDKITRKHSSKSFSDYLRDGWAELYGDARYDSEQGYPDQYNSLGGEDAQNPWA